MVTESMFLISSFPFLASILPELELSEFPSHNITVVQGQRFSFRCSYFVHKELSTFVYLYHNQTTTRIGNNLNCSETVMLPRRSQSYLCSEDNFCVQRFKYVHNELVISYVIQEDAGEYHCRAVIVDRSTRFSAFTTFTLAVGK